MASNIFSRLLPQSTAPSIYDTLRQAAEQDDESDIEERAGLLRDDFSDNLHSEGYGRTEAERRPSSNLNHPFRDDSPVHLRSPSSRPSQSASRSPEWRRGRVKATEEDEANDDVPLSLLVEGDSPEASPTGFKRLPPRPSDEPDYVPIEDRPGSRDRGRWDGGRSATQQARSRLPAFARRPFAGNPLLLAGEREKAMWRWTNVSNLDHFLKQVYGYYLGKGIYSIVLMRLLDLMTVAFVVGFGLFLTTCVDYGKIPGSTKMSQILVPKCTQRMSTFKYTVIIVVASAWLWQFFAILLDVRRLWHMHQFYTYLLDIPDSDIQTVNWQQVVGRLMTLRDLNANTAADNQRTRRFLGTQSKQRMDAHDIANRLMRRENYLIAMINKDILDLDLHIPYLGKYHVFSKTIEWNVGFAILDMVFDHNGQVNPMFLGSAQRTILSEALQRRFRSAAVFNMVTAPFHVLYMTLLYFFKYFQEYQKNPGRLGVREYTPLAEWKFREFNELDHLLHRRLRLSHNIANLYLNHWPKYKTIQVASFVSLITGALASVLVLASLWDPEVFLGFEITHDRTVLFYTGILVAIWGAARNVEPEDAEAALPDEAMEVICNFTHFKPEHWQGKLHSDDVRKEFSSFYKVKLVIFIEELLSIILVPFILWFNLPSCSNRIVDFFREFTVHVDGLGYVCSFALFDFKNGRPNAADRMGQGGDTRAGGGHSDPRDDYYATKDNKMMSSYMHFMDAYHHDPTGRKPMAQLAQFHATHRNRQFHPPPAFPGLDMGASAVAHRAATGDAPISPVTERRPTGGGLRSQRTPRFAATTNAGVASPGGSLLLDPAHQPASGSTFRHMGARSAMQSQLRKSRMAPMSRDDVIGEEEEGGVGGVGGVGGAGGAVEESNTQRPAGDSHTSSGHDEGISGLGGSWKTTRAGDVEDDEDDDEGGAEGELNLAQEEGGMLGLIAQFSKAQARGGVQI